MSTRSKGQRHGLTSYILAVRERRSAMVDAETVVQLALAQQGDRYVANAQNDVNDPNPSSFDCSELVRWACGRAGVQPTMPDGSWIQQRWCRSNGTILSVEQAIGTRGALLFKHRDANGNPV